MKLQLNIKSYIAEPYWPELCQRIEVDTKSRIHRIRNEEKRQASLESYLERIGQSMEWYKALHEKEKEKFYKNSAGFIIIPEHQMRGCLLEGIRSNTRLWKKKGLTVNNFRVDVEVSDFTTTKTEKDGVYDRYINNLETNMRRRTLSEFIHNFTATGTVKINEGIEQEDVLELFRYAFKNCGVGGARKMAYGRGIVKVVEDKPELNWFTR